MSENQPEYGYDQDAEPSLNAPGDEGPTGIVAPDASTEGDEPDASDGDDVGPGAATEPVEQGERP